MFKYIYGAKELTNFFNMISSFNSEVVLHAKEGMLTGVVMDISNTMMMWTNISAKENLSLNEEPAVFVLNVDEILTYLKSFKGDVEVRLEEEMLELITPSKVANIRTLGEKPCPTQTPPTSDVVVVHLDEGEFKDYISSYTPLLKKFGALSFKTYSEGVYLEGESESNIGNLRINIPKTKVEISKINQKAIYSLDFLIDIVKNMPPSRTSLYFQTNFPLHIHSTTSDESHNMRIWIAPRISEEDD